tara:strand:- start:1062 stop:1607 length:546 start_codon:yes stop_codon:yes gene_type:complete
MSEKKNFWTQTLSAMNGKLSFGAISFFKDVLSSVRLQALDGRHFLAMEEDGQRKGWTTINSPGATQINSGEDLTKEDDCIFVNAENGNIVIKARDGKVRIEGTDIELCATGNTPEGRFWLNANESIQMDSKNILIKSKQGMSIISTGSLTLDGRLGMQILAPIIHGATCATKPNKQPGEIN